MFSGSYSPSDMVFLLEPDNSIPILSHMEKEEIIRKGGHYSDVLAEEAPPDAARMDFFHLMLARYGRRTAREAMWLAKRISARDDSHEICLLSVARAGNPLGVLLVRALRGLGRRAVNYGISVVKERGIDRKALDFVRARHKNFWFIDGWTGKGAIASELKGLGGKLAVLSDPACVADLSSSCNDWPIPFGILGATISGLISRTVWSGKGFHKCRFHPEWNEIDHSVSFADHIASFWTDDDSLEKIMQKYGISDINKVKPGIAEATRAVSRRTPVMTLIHHPNDPELALLVEKSRELGIPVIMEETGIYKAIAVIR